MLSLRIQDKVFHTQRKRRLELTTGKGPITCYVAGTAVNPVMDINTNV